MWAVVDRIEGQRAILELEDGDIVEIDKKHLPPGAEAGSVLRITLSFSSCSRSKLKVILRTEPASAPGGR